jgi:STE24 endopeptidase
MAALSHWRRVDGDAADWFDAAEIEQGRAYNRPLQRLRAVRFVLSAVLTIAFIAGEAAPRLLDAIDVRGWVWEVLVVAVAFTLIHLVIDPWFDAYKELVWDRRWELSTQTVRGFVSDQAKGLAVEILLNAVLVVPLWAVIRATDLWWLWGWLLLTGFTLLLNLLHPIVIAPLFNRFTPLGDEALAGRIMEVAERTELDVSGVLVADASRRSRAGNAYVAGLGKTRRVVVFDTILDWPHEHVEQVVAHELGHWRHAHIRRKLPVIIGAQLLLFVGTWTAMRWDWLLEVGGVRSVEDPAAFPIFITVFSVGFVLVGLATSWLSRADERQADLFALDVLRQPEVFSAMFQRLAGDNKADVDPPRWKRLTASHPPIPERLAMAAAWEDGQPSAK